ncbi:acylphosphatase, partial [Candidatus Parcubacteria bacterium]
MSKVRAHVYIEGHVQGVFFRDTTRQRALALGVTGWVRNLIDGRVEAIFEGEEEAVHQMVQFVQKGPPRAIVTHVDVEYGD